MKRKMIFTAIFFVAAFFLCKAVFAASDEIKVKRIYINPESTTVRVNQTRTLRIRIYPDDAEDQTVYWTSSNPEIVAVDDEGVLPGISPGTAEVTVTSNNDKSATCVVTVPGAVLKNIPQDTDNQSHTGAEASEGEVLSAASIRVDVENAVRSTASGETATVTYTNKTTVSTAALRAAAFTAEYEGGKVRLRFITAEETAQATIFDPVDTSSYHGWLTIDPGNAPDEDRNINLCVYTSGEEADSALQKAQSHFNGKIAVVQLGQQGSYGVAVTVTAKADLSEMDTNALKLYIYDSDTNTYTLLENQAYSLNSNGYVTFITDTGGTIVLTA